MIGYFATGGYRWRMDVTQAQTARRLAAEMSRMAELAAALADAAVWELTRRETAKDVARAMGVSEPTVRKAIRLHNARQKPLTEGTESDAESRAMRPNAA